MHPVGFEPTISAGERPQTYALDRAASGTGFILYYIILYYIILYYIILYYIILYYIILYYIILYYIMLSFGVSSCLCNLNAFDIPVIQTTLQLKHIVSSTEIVQYAANLFCAVAELKS